MEVTQNTDGPPGVLDATLGPAPYPVLAVNAAGAVTRLNDAARSLLGVVPGGMTGARMPEWLAEAHRALAAAPAPATAEPVPPSPVPHLPEPVAHGSIGDRFFAAHAVPDGAGAASGAARDHAAGTVWWLFDVTEKQRLARELAAERERTSFLADASSQLLASLNLERCMEVTVRLASGTRCPPGSWPRCCGCAAGGSTTSGPRCRRRS